jgi:hypothetical protein
MSDTKIGVEVEYPQVMRSKLTERPKKTTDVYESQRFSLRGASVIRDGHVTYDGTVGIEAVSDPLKPSRAALWWEDTIEDIEHHTGTIYGPCGDIEGSTAGAHIHMSPAAEEDMRWLARESREPWLRAFVCSSVFYEDRTHTKIFRGGGYCNMGYGTAHFKCVNSRGGDHYEWRLPEPLCQTHVQYVTEFVDKVVQGRTAAAKRYAIRKMKNRPRKITSVRRMLAIYDEMETSNDVFTKPFGESADFFNHMDSRDDVTILSVIGLNGKYFYYLRGEKGTTVDLLPHSADSHKVTFGDVPITVPSDDPTRKTSVGEHERVKTKVAESRREHVNNPSNATEYVKKVINEEV